MSEQAKQQATQAAGEKLDRLIKAVEEGNRIARDIRFALSVALLFYFMHIFASIQKKDAGEAFQAFLLAVVLPMIVFFVARAAARALEPSIRDFVRKVDN